jgi:hypothetical protein
MKICADSPVQDLYHMTATHFDNLKDVRVKGSRAAAYALYLNVRDPSYRIDPESVKILQKAHLLSKSVHIPKSIRKILEDCLVLRDDKDRVVSLSIRELKEVLPMRMGDVYWFRSIWY